jgi:hypothetical protein
LASFGFFNYFLFNPPQPGRHTGTTSTVRALHQALSWLYFSWFLYFYYLLSLFITPQPGRHRGTLLFKLSYLRSLHHKWHTVKVSRVNYSEATYCTSTASVIMSNTMDACKSILFVECIINYRSAWANLTPWATRENNGVLDCEVWLCELLPMAEDSFGNPHEQANEVWSNHKSIVRKNEVYGTLHMTTKKCDNAARVLHVMCAACAGACGTQISYHPA